MAHLETEAADIQSDEANDEVETEDFELATPHVTEAMTLDEGAAAIAKILEAEDRPEVPATAKAKKENVKENTPAPVEASVDDDAAEEAEEQSEEDADAEAEPDETENEESTDEQEPAEEEGEVIKPPVSWSKEMEALFKKAPPELQKTIVEQEANRDRGYQIKATEAKEQRQRAADLEVQLVSERQQATQYIARLLGHDLVEPRMEDFSDNPWDYQEAMKGFKAKQAQFQRIQQANYQNQQYLAARDRQQQQAFDQYRTEILNKELPQYGDYQYKEELKDYALKNNVSEDEFNSADPYHMILVDKAMKYDRLMAAKGDLKPVPPDVPKVQKPGAQSRSGAKQSLLAAKNKLKQTGKVEDAARVIEHLL